MDKTLKQAVLVKKESPDQNTHLEKIALFNANGSGFSGDLPRNDSSRIGSWDGPAVLWPPTTGEYTDKGGVGFGYVDSNPASYIRVVGYGSSARPGLAFGYARSGGNIRAGQGGLAFGSSRGSSASITARPYGHAFGSTYVGTNNPGKPDLEVCKITAGYGALAFGTVMHGPGGTGLGTGKIYSSWPGNIAAGRISVESGGYGYIYSANRGCFAQGFVRAHGSSTTLKATGRGSFAQGYANGGNIEATGNGSRASGISGGAPITASGSGSFAHGSSSGAAITASGTGAFSFGYASTGNPITASAINSFQFGKGVNAQADSLSVGVGPRLKGTVGAPSIPRNGDIWVANNYMYLQSNGVSKKIV